MSANSSAGDFAAAALEEEDDDDADDSVQADVDDPDAPAPAASPASFGAVSQAARRPMAAIRTKKRFVMVYTPIEQPVKPTF